MSLFLTFLGTAGHILPGVDCCRQLGETGEWHGNLICCSFYVSELSDQEKGILSLHVVSHSTVVCYPSWSERHDPFLQGRTVAYFAARPSEQAHFQALLTFSYPVSTPVDMQQGGGLLSIRQQFCVPVIAT
jgi:hypothetical protein